MRYERQRMMAQIGEKGQEKLKAATVVVVGCGGLGSPVLTYLTCAGIGKLHLIDFDVVSASNLNRQFLYTSQDIGRSKVDCAKEHLQQLNEDIEVVGFHEKIRPENIEHLIESATVVVDCVDNLETRMVLGRACLKKDIPLVEAGVEGFYGWIMSIGRATACLACMGFDQMKPSRPGPIIGTTAGVVGTLQANECIKIILGMEGTLFGRMLQYDGINGSLDAIALQKSHTCSAHGV